VFGDGVAHAMIDMYGHASTQEAIAMADRLAAEEGLLVGPSSGGAIHAAIQLAMTDEAAGKTIVVIQASSGIRYVTHPMWDPERTEAAAALPSTPTKLTEPLLLWRSEDYEEPKL
jgi:cysteine synthase A